VARFRLISLFTLVVALGGASAGPTRVVESTRLVASISRFDERRETRPARPAHRLDATVARPDVLIAPRTAPRATPARSALVTHARFQRPPPVKS
jgi:hypothetical protein